MEPGDRAGVVARAVAALLGEPPRGVRPAGEGRDTWDVELADRSSAVFKGGRGSDADIEAWACRRAATADVPVPSVLAVDGAGRAYPGGCLVVARIEGVPLNLVDLSPSERTRVVREAGVLLRRLHGIVGAGFGRPRRGVLRETGTLRGAEASWRDAVIGAAGEALAEAASVIPEGLASEIEEAVDRRRGLLRHAIPNVLHGDFVPRHVLVHPDRTSVAGLVDFEGLQVGDPALDVAVFTFLRDDDLEDLLAGYGREVLGASLRARLVLYRLVRAVSEVAWARMAGSNDDDLARRLAHVRRTVANL